MICCRLRIYHRAWNRPKVGSKSLRTLQLVFSMFHTYHLFACMFILNIYTYTLAVVVSKTYANHCSFIMQKLYVTSRIISRKKVFCKPNVYMGRSICIGWMRKEGQRFLHWTRRRFTGGRQEALQTWLSGISVQYMEEKNFVRRLTNTNSERADARGVSQKKEP